MSSNGSSSEERIRTAEWIMLSSAVPLFVGFLLFASGYRLEGIAGMLLAVAIGLFSIYVLENGVPRVGVIRHG